MKKKLLVFSLIIFHCLNLYGQSTDEYESVPLKLVFQNMGYNALHSFTDNYCLNFAAACLVTYGSMESGLDLYWRNMSYNNPTLTNTGSPGLFIGVAVPAFTPVALFLAGRKNQNTKLQVTALALTQTLMLTLAIQSPMKMITDRPLPGILDSPVNKRGLATDDHSKTFNWFTWDFFNGWPSGHTANAFSAAATIAELYKDNLWLKIGVYSYAALIGFSVSVSVHWASEAFAGAIIGYAIGKTVGKSFSRLLENNPEEDNVSFYVTPNSVGIRISM
ncbi:MAG: phosphatase PAP2 family protein [Treponema sp.]|jgi:membrane-associated phospholipid phosphatase|nr:phosphatase PAP2 family protein [Treponema sp.]